MVAKYWKEAASLILLSKIRFATTTSRHKPSNPTLTSQSRPGRQHSKTNYEILILERNKNSSFMPRGCVFPGGAVDAADVNDEWVDLYRKNNLEKELLNLISHDQSFESVTFMSPNSNQNFSESLSLRIAAIRETFEECGILLCKSLQSHSNQPSQWVSYMAGHKLKQWQTIVHNNPHEFINLCRSFDCYPDIWSLQKWSNWLTPTHFQKRFNTAFFLAVLDHPPPSYADGKEITNAKWSCPNHLLDLHEAGDIWLPPPQVYEITRLANYFSDAAGLASYGSCVNKNMTCMYMPIRVKTVDGEVLLLPGDDLYPDKPDYEKASEQQLCKTIDELRSESTKLHRIECLRKQTKVIFPESSALKVHPTEN